MTERQIDRESGRGIEREKESERQRERKEGAKEPN